MPSRADRRPNDGTINCAILEPKGSISRVNEKSLHRAWVRGEETRRKKRRGDEKKEKEVRGMDGMDVCTHQLRQVLLQTISFISAFLCSIKSNIASSVTSMLEMFSVCIFVMHLYA